MELNTAFTTADAQKKTKKLVWESGGREIARG
jgi:hypothetical protein